jgi:hypothetical protein
VFNHTGFNNAMNKRLILAVLILVCSGCITADKAQFSERYTQTLRVIAKGLLFDSNYYVLRANGEKKISYCFKNFGSINEPNDQWFQTSIHCELLKNSHTNSHINEVTKEIASNLKKLESYLTNEIGISIPKAIRYRIYLLPKNTSYRFKIDIHPKKSTLVIGAIEIQNHLNDTQMILKEAIDVIAHELWHEIEIASDIVRHDNDFQTLVQAEYFGYLAGYCSLNYLDLNTSNYINPLDINVTIDQLKQLKNYSFSDIQIVKAKDFDSKRRKGRIRRNISALESAVLLLASDILSIDNFQIKNTLTSKDRKNIDSFCRNKLMLRAKLHKQSEKQRSRQAANT